MSKARVPVYNTPNKAVYIETDATKGATLGVDLYYNGTLLTPDQVLNDSSKPTTTVVQSAPAPSSQASSGQAKIQPRQNGALKGPSGTSNLNFIGAPIHNDGLTASIIVNLTGAASGTNAYALTTSSELDGYFNGLVCVVTFPNANTGASTLNLNSLGAKAIQLNGAALTSGQIPENSTLELLYDGTNFQITGLVSVGPTGHGSTTTTAAPSASGDYWIFTLADTTAFSAVGLPIYCVDAENASNWIRGHVISFSSTQLTVVPDATGGTISSITNGSTFTFSGVAGSQGTAGANASAYVGVTTNSGNAYTATPSPALASYVTGTLYTAQINAANTGAVTINISGLGAKDAYKNNAEMTGGELVAGMTAAFTYDGTQFQFTGDGGGSGGGGLTRVAKSANYTVTTSDANTYFDCTGTFTLSLLAAATAGNSFGIEIYNSGTGWVTVPCNGSDTMLGMFGAIKQYRLDPLMGIKLICTGSGWEIRGRMHTKIPPCELFLSSYTAGAIFDPTDFSTLFQNAAGTTPVTATGQTVMYMKDVSGLGHDFSQATSGSAPIIRQDANGAYYLDFTSTKYMDAIGGAVLSSNEVTIAFAVNALSATNARLFDTRGPGANGAIKGWQLKARNSSSDLFFIDDGAGNYSQFSDPGNLYAFSGTVGPIVISYSDTTGFFSVRWYQGMAAYGSTISRNTFGGTGNPSTNTSTKTSRIGAESGGTTQPFNGYFYGATVLPAKTLLTSQAVEALYTYYFDKLKMQ